MANDENDIINNLIKWAINHKTIIANFDISEEEIRKHIIDINKIYQAYQKCEQNHDKSNQEHYHFQLTKEHDYIYLISYLCPNLFTNPNYLLEQNIFYSNVDYHKNQQLLIQQDIIYEQQEINKIKLIKLLLKIKKTNHLDVKGIYIYGNNDIGKSYLITAFCNDMAIKNNSIIYLILTHFMIDIKKSLSNKDNFIDQIREQLLAVDILVIDEFDQEPYNNFLHNQILYPILNGRNNEKKLTIFIAKNNLQTIQKRFKYQSKDYQQIDNLINRIQRLVNKNIYDLNIKKIN